MRSVWLSCAGFVLAALIWALYSPFSARVLVLALGNERHDTAEVERELWNAGSSATPALRNGLADHNVRIRLRCARLLSLQGDRHGDETLLDILREHGSDPFDTAGATAEEFITAVWEQRDGPPAAVRRKLLQSDSFDTDAERIKALNETLANYPRWATGFALRSKVRQRNGQIPEAWGDALEVLKIEPNNFDGMVLFAGCQLMINSPEQAYRCYEQAVRTNPRLKATLKNEIHDVLKTLDLEKEQRRREKRREIPVA